MSAEITDREAMQGVKALILCHDSGHLSAHDVVQGIRHLLEEGQAECVVAG